MSSGLMMNECFGVMMIKTLVACIVGAYCD